MTRWERAARILFDLTSLSTLYFAFRGPNTPWAYLGFLGVLPLLSGITGYCVLCHLLCRCREIASGTLCRTYDLAAGQQFSACTAGRLAPSGNNLRLYVRLAVYRF
ncbi:MAG: YgaP family membrane protein [Desulfotomaculales bacterium]